MLRGLRRLVIAVVSTSLVLGMVPVPVSAASNCQLCIVEVHAASEIGELSEQLPSEDYLIVYNRSLTSLSSIKLLYRTAAGLLVDSVSMSVGTIPVGGTKVFAGAGILQLNGTATSLGEMNLHPAGGVLQLAKATATSTTTYDQVAWGTAPNAEGSPVSAPSLGQSFSRILVDGIVQDSGDNAADFQLTDVNCVGAQITEIQPMVADAAGAPLEAWIELVGIDKVVGNCQLVTLGGDLYDIPAADLPIPGQTVVINRGINSAGEVVPLHLGNGQVWFASSSIYGDPTRAYAPVMTITYPSLEMGQTWSLIDSLWRATYASTPYEANRYQPLPTPPTIDETICASVRINELLPNPAGDDAENEWVELHNFGSQSVLLGSCQLVIGTTVYGFSNFDGLWPDEYRTDNTFYSPAGNEIWLSLLNSSDSPLFVAWQRVNPGGSVDVLQSFYLYDGRLTTTAPEDRSLARYNDGWTWADPSPGSANPVTPDVETSIPTENPVGGSMGDTTVLTPGPKIEVTELLPNPAAPLSDDADEYVEIYNPNDYAVNLAGYTVQVGDTFSYSYTFPDRMIAARQYLTVTSGISKLSLSNTSGQARVLEPTSTVVSHTDPYTKAPEGQAWAKINGVWMWTATATPAAMNVYIPPLAKVSTTVKKTSTAAAAKKTTTSSPKTTATNKAAAAVKSATTNTANAIKAAPLHTAVLAVVGGLALLYAAYEYRTDIANRIYQFRRYRANRRANRTAPKGR